jgi:membrane protein insertase Oxa1/YidC/SpoIIIJ
MLTSFWFSYLYQPVFNALVWIYSNVANESLGWAVVWLTVFLRLILLPLTIKSEKDAYRREKAETEAKENTKQFRNDFVVRKEEIRKIIKRNKISPWAKVISLGIQLLVLVLLYQVFINGIEGRKVVSTLYEFIDYPGKLNTDFYGFHIGKRYDYIWAGVSALYLAVSIFLPNRGRKWNRGKMSFLILFPLFTFFALWFLPMVKSLFILTSMVFSDTIGLLVSPFMKPKKKAK